MEVRKEAVANMFYPADKTELKAMIRSFLAKVKLKEKYENTKAVVCPHAWYIYSGEIAAYSYKAIEENWENIPPTFVLLWPSHHNLFSWVSIWMYEAYSTPFWNIEVDLELWKDLINRFPEVFNELKEPHLKEHSLEVQLPFLKYISKWNDFKILPMIFWEVNPLLVWKMLNEILKEKDFFIIVSSDLSHYKPYNEAKEIDSKTIESFLSEDIDKIINNADACWAIPWVCLNEIAKLNNWKAKLLNYKNSWDTAWDKNRVVWYASLIYKL